MMLVVDQSPPECAIPASERWADLCDDLSTSQSDDGRIIDETIRRALRHWFDRAKFLLEDSSDEELDLKPVVLRAIGTIRVKYRPGSRLTAMPYDFGDECTTSVTSE